MTDPVPQMPTEQVPQGADPAAMLSAMGQSGGVQQGTAPEDAAMQIQNTFVDLGSGLQQWMKKITDLAGQFPAFAPRAQKIAQAAMEVHDELNEGMMESIQQLRQQEPIAPPSGY
jgi:hypothetical protein